MHSARFAPWYCIFIIFCHSGHFHGAAVLLFSAVLAIFRILHSYYFRPFWPLSGACILNIFLRYAYSAVFGGSFPCNIIGLLMRCVICTVSCALIRVAWPCFVGQDLWPIDKHTSDTSLTGPCTWLALHPPGPLGHAQECRGGAMISTKSCSNSEVHTICSLLLGSTISVASPQLTGSPRGRGPGAGAGPPSHSTPNLHLHGLGSTGFRFWGGGR